MNVFDIIIGMDNDLSDLKELIKEKRSPQFDSFASFQLILWHINVDFSAISTINDILSEENELINSANTVKETFFNLKGKNVRVVIGVPIMNKPFPLNLLSDNIRVTTMKKNRVET
ncbi:hypothetical protein C2G38_783625 [Gigaspora rosea]|uniref:Crinkler effector protein N-terminal domain-containing protein n=1 Tax=Gigaspora rosea TaxID=44941 RepID=A0A397VPF7_9GLOM|nr:hypothetical protein C2G38_783625 [Gigaspora rosea]